ncbi:Uncharacterised protein [Yersinia aleksiciae]|nr:Uncharacterised protein [Yersinia aleksiciae]
MPEVYGKPNIKAGAGRGDSASWRFGRLCDYDPNGTSPLQSTLWARWGMRYSAEFKVLAGHLIRFSLMYDVRDHIAPPVSQYVLPCHGR